MNTTECRKQYYRDYSKRYYAEHRKECLEKHKKDNSKRRDQYSKYREEVLSHYGHRCQWPDGCEVTDSDMLQIDHINGGGHIERKKGLSGTKFLSYLIINNYPIGYRILCANHNCKYRADLRRESNEVRI